MESLTDYAILFNSMQEMDSDLRALMEALRLGQTAVARGHRSARRRCHVRSKAASECGAAGDIFVYAIIFKNKETKGCSRRRVTPTFMKQLTASGARPNCMRMRSLRSWKRWMTARVEDKEE